MYDQWQQYEEEVLKEFHEKGLSNKKIKVWDLLIEYPLNKEKFAWATVGDLKEILHFPKLSLVPLKLERFWDFKKINPKELIKLIESGQVIVMSTVAPRSFKGQLDWIKEIILTTKKTFGFLPSMR